MSRSWAISEGMASAVCMILALGCGSDDPSRSGGPASEAPDSIPPAAVRDLLASTLSHSQIVLTWTAPGDDADAGTCAAYDVRFSTTAPGDPVAWWQSHDVSTVTYHGSPKAAGSPESLMVRDLQDSTAYWFGMAARDDSLNWSALSNIATDTTKAYHPPDPHARAVLLVHLNPSLAYTVGSSYAGRSDLTRGEQAICTGEVISEQATAQIWFVIAAFADSGEIDLAGVDFGLGDYDPSRISVEDAGACNGPSLAMPSDGWPGPNEGVALVYLPPRHTRLTELYWFATYAYAPVSMPLAPDSQTGRAEYVTSDSPPKTFGFLGLGAMGFGAEGHNPPIP